MPTHTDPPGETVVEVRPQVTEFGFEKHLKHENIWHGEREWGGVTFFGNRMVGERHTEKQRAADTALGTNLQ